MQKQKFQKLLEIVKYSFLLYLFLIIFFVHKIIGIELRGDYIQGGLIIGNASQSTKLFLDGISIPTDNKGNFLFGFGRNHPNISNLKIVSPEGEITKKKLLIKSRKYNIQKINNLDNKKVTPPKEFYERIKNEVRIIKAAKSIKVSYPYYKKGFIIPTQGVITGVYGSQRILNGKPRRPHYGLDIANIKGTSVIATSDGIIVLAENDLYFSGGTVIISHGQGLTSSYLHLSSISVVVGEKVVQGQNVGQIGATGRATGPHLDWRMEIRGVRIDPRLLLK